MSVPGLTQTRTILIAGCFVGLLLLTACVPLIRDSHATVLPTSVPASAAQTNAQVVINNFTFTPAVITVTLGTTLTWLNQDDTPHTVTAADKQFGSKGLDTDDQFVYRFTAVGVYTYFCSIHPMMTGHIVVQ